MHKLSYMINWRQDNKRLLSCCTRLQRLLSVITELSDGKRTWQMEEAIKTAPQCPGAPRCHAHCRCSWEAEQFFPIRGLEQVISSLVSLPYLCHDSKISPHGMETGAGNMPSCTSPCQPGRESPFSACYSQQYLEHWASLEGWLLQ